MFKGLVGAVILGSAMLANASQSADAVIAAATEANKQSKSLGYEWNVTGTVSYTHLTLPTKA